MVKKISAIIITIITFLSLSYIPVLAIEKKAPQRVSIDYLKNTPPTGSDFTLIRRLSMTKDFARWAIDYKSDGLKITGTLHIPRGKGPFPVVLTNHGYIDTRVYTTGRGLRREQDYLARAGFAVLHSDYRNHAGSDKDPFVDEELRFGYARDVHNAIVALQKAQLPQLNTEKIAMMGHSMGGGIAWQLLTAHPTLVDAWFLYAPVSADATDNFKRWTERRREIAQKVENVFGTPNDNPRAWESISPLAHLPPSASPIHIHHGTRDESTPYEWSVKAANEAQKQGLPIRLWTYSGEKHEFSRDWALMMRRIEAELRRVWQS